jgi:hypothetical protein
MKTLSHYELSSNAIAPITGLNVDGEERCRRGQVGGVTLGPEQGGDYKDPGQHDFDRYMESIFVGGTASGPPSC